MRETNVDIAESRLNSTVIPTFGISSMSSASCLTSSHLLRASLFLVFADNPINSLTIGADYIDIHILSVAARRCVIEFSYRAIHIFSINERTDIRTKDASVTVMRQ